MTGNGSVWPLSGCKSQHPTVKCSGAPLLPHPHGYIMIKKTKNNNMILNSKIAYQFIY